MNDITQNPYEYQRRMVKACKIADKAEELGYTTEEMREEVEWEAWAKRCGVKKPSRETWDLAVILLRNRLDYEGNGGIDDPRFIQTMGAMAVQITETLDRHGLDSDEADNLTNRDRLTVARLSRAKPDEATFDLGRWFLKMREEHRFG